MSNFLKATAVRDTVLTALSRMLTMAPTVWRDAGGSFRGVFGDTITIRVPAYTNADTRVMRSGSARARRGLFESPVTVTLDTNVYRDVVLTDENQTLDIMSFSRQVLNPMLEGVAREIEDDLIATATGATYEYSVVVDPSDPIAALVQARKHLNDSRAPMTNRFVALGSSVEAAMLNADLLRQVNTSGTNQALRRGVIGDLYGFTVLSVPGLPPESAYAYHQTAYALSLQAPIVPDGAPAGFTTSQDGFAIRLVQVLDSATIENIVAADVFVGSTEITDHGTVDDDGVFTPAEDHEASGVDELFVRAVELDFTASA